MQIVLQKICSCHSTKLAFAKKRLHCICSVSCSFFVADILMFHLHYFGFVHWKLCFCLLHLGVLEFSWGTPSSCIWNFSFYFFNNNARWKPSFPKFTNFRVYCKKWHLKSSFVDCNTHLYSQRKKETYLLEKGN